MPSGARYGAQNNYLQQNVMTASPGELTLMLYDACAKDLKLAIAAIDRKDVTKANENLLKAQAIITELMRSLKLKYDIGKQLYSLYDYMLSELVEANITKNVAKIAPILQMTVELRDTWQQAIKLNRQQTSVAPRQGIGTQA